MGEKRASHFPIIAKARNVPQWHRGPRGGTAYSGARASSPWCQAGGGKPTGDHFCHLPRTQKLEHLRFHSEFCSLHHSLKTLKTSSWDNH